MTRNTSQSPTVLPTHIFNHPNTRHAPKPAHHSLRRFVRRLTLRRLITLAFILSAVLIWLSIPPGFADLYAHEREQAYAVAAYHPNARYVLFEDQWTGLGLNNILQEVLMLSHLSRSADRVYVFHPYTWSLSRSPFVVDSSISFPFFRLRPSRIPLSAFVSIPPVDSASAVSREVWDDICPPDKRTVFDETPDNWSAHALLDWWTSRLRDHPARCLSVKFNGRRPFGFNFFSSSDFLTLYPILTANRGVTQFDWSGLVYDALRHNLAKLFDENPSGDGVGGTLSELVAVHLRRGDFREHCDYMADQKMGWMGMNAHTALPDRFSESSASKDDFRMRCFPTPEEAAARIGAIISGKTSIRKVYILTDGPQAEVYAIAALLPDLQVRSSWDLYLKGEENYVAVAVDMALAERASMFIGNGWSSLSANVVMHRFSREMDPDSTRFL